MAQSCVLVPNKRGTETPSELFTELNKAFGRDMAKVLYTLSESSEVMNILGLNVMEEPSISDFCEAIMRNYGKEFKTEFGIQFYSNLANYAENLVEDRFDNFSEAQSALTGLSIDYEDLVPIVNEDSGKYKIQLVPKTTQSTIKQAKQMALYNLNKKLEKYMAKLGFAAERVDNLETPGVFSPLNAETNAQNLKQAIRISKNQAGEEALPEEFAHLLLTGYKNNPLVQRLVTALTQNRDVIEEILGVDYDAYAEKYNSDINLLADEAAARLVAQNLVDRSDVPLDVQFISDKALEKIRQNLSQGNESDIDKMLSDMIKDVNNIVDELVETDDSLDMFDPNLVTNAPAMYHLQKEIKNVKDGAEKALETLSKRARLIQVKEGKARSTDIKEYTKLKQAIEGKKYATGCIGFLSYVMDDLANIQRELIETNKTIQELKKKGEGTTAAANLTKKMFKYLRNIESVRSSYEDIIKSLQRLTRDSTEDSQNLTDEDLATIKENASKVRDKLGDLEGSYNDMRLRALVNFFGKYWTQDLKTLDSEGKEVALTLEDVLQSTMGDMSGWDRLINSMSDATDPMLQLVDIAYKDAANTRDNNIFSLQQYLGQIQKEYMAAGGSRDVSWMYVRDAAGKLTGMLISDRDYTKFYEDKRKYKQSLKDQGVDENTITYKLREWEHNHCEPVSIIGLNGRVVRKEMMPKLSEYPSDALKGLSAAQRDYYNKIMVVKAELDKILPRKGQKHYMAPQKQLDTKEALIQTKNLKGVFNKAKRRYLENVNDKDYGYIVTDEAGEPVQRIPVYYTTRLKDMATLDTNLTEVMLSYGAMAFNYQSMNSIADAMEIANSQMQDRQFVKMNGRRKVFSRFTFMGKAFESDYTIPGSQSVTAKKLRNYIDSNIYGKRKDMQTLHLGNQEINIGKLGDDFKQYASVLGLGYNIFSGTTNVTMGLAQTIIQAIGGAANKDAAFGIKNVIRAHKLYNKDLPGVIADGYSDIKDNKLALIMQKFDAEEEYYQNVDDSTYNKGLFKNMLNKHSSLIFNSMGEHYLHGIGALATLDRQKVLFEGKEISLYDALEVSTKDGNPELKIKDGVTNLDGSEVTEKDLFRVKMLIQDANHKMHGAFNSVDRGDIHRNVLGRLAAQFRQWMPAFYNERFERERYNLKTGLKEEGFYITAANFIVGTVTDLFHLKYNVGTRYRELSNAEKGNLFKALAEVSLLYLIGAALKGLGGPDKDDPWALNGLKYNMYRLKMELGAAAPTSTDFVKNVTTLIRSPLPAVEQVDRIFNLFKFSNMGRTIQSGKYEGWNVWLRDFYFLVPYVKNVRRLPDLMEGDLTMFNPYLNPMPKLNN